MVHSVERSAATSLLRCVRLGHRRATANGAPPRPIIRLILFILFSALAGHIVHLTVSGTRVVADGRSTIPRVIRPYKTRG